MGFRWRDPSPTDLTFKFALLLRHSHPHRPFTMKFAPAFALLVASASAFTAPTMTFAVGKKSATKVVKKAAPKPKPAAKKAAPVVKKAAPKKAVASAVRV